MPKLASLSERMRPKTLDEIEGISEASKILLRQFIEQKHYRSLILWGQPGSGKSSLAKVLLGAMDIPTFEFSAAHHGVKELKAVLEKHSFCAVFVDEIHRFSKLQQDIFLQPVEAGQLILLGATTENPGFSVNKALLSRCLLLNLEILDKQALRRILHRALRDDLLLQTKQIEFEDEDLFLQCAQGDARRLLLSLEVFAQGEKVLITAEQLRNLAKVATYDKHSNAHHAYASAFIKSMRGSDPNAALYWCARMLHGGEDPLFIARRMLIFASEDIGLANSNAVLLANATFEAVQKLGMPEARIILGHCIIFLSTSLKSNSAYKAINHALELVKKTPTSHQEVPQHLRNDPMTATNYQYPHDFPEHFLPVNYLPENLKGYKFYEPANNPRETELRRELRGKWRNFYDYSENPE